MVEGESTEDLQARARRAVLEAIDRCARHADPHRGGSTEVRNLAEAYTLVAGTKDPKERPPGPVMR
jgi:hypothetical protein